LRRCVAFFRRCVAKICRCVANFRRCVRHFCRCTLTSIKVTHTMIKITQTTIEVTQTMVDLPHPTPKMTDPAAGTPAPEPEEDNPVAIGWKAGREDGGTVRGGGGAEGWNVPQRCAWGRQAGVGAPWTAFAKTPDPLVNSHVGHTLNLGDLLRGKATSGEQDHRDQVGLSFARLSPTENPWGW
jgi:hypothetical protein